MDGGRIIVGIVVLLVFVYLVLWVTWLFFARVRHGESAPKSFFRWLGDLVDLVFGL